MSKLTLSLAAATLAASLGAYAAVPTGAAPFQVVVPNLKSGIEFTLEGLYLQPTNSDLNYAAVYTGVSPTTNTALVDVDPDYDFGFRLGIGYIFPDSGNDVQLSWTHFDQDSNEASSTLIDSGSSVTSNSDVNFTYNAIDLDVGQYISIGTRLQTRLFMGLRYAQLQNDITDNYVGFDSGSSVPVFTQAVQLNSEFTGIGPRFGVDAAYHVGNCFGVVGHVAAALLVGRVESSSNATLTFESNIGTPTSEAGATLTSLFNVTTDNQTRVVPGFDAKLGFDYSWPFQNDASRLTLEAGYQATQYIDAIDRLQSDGSIVTSGIGFNGPYLNLNFKM